VSTSLFRKLILVLAVAITVTPALIVITPDVSYADSTLPSDAIVTATQVAEVPLSSKTFDVKITNPAGDLLDEFDLYWSGPDLPRTVREVEQFIESLQPLPPGVYCVNIFQNYCVGIG
jgi:hypothetical protein